MAEGKATDSCAGNGAMSWHYGFCSCWEHARPLRRSRTRRMPGAATEEAVRLTIEVNWSMPSKGTEAGEAGGELAGSGQDAEVVLKTTSGRVVDAVAWPTEAGRVGTTALSEVPSDFGPGPGGSWRLGRERGGRVRARIEAPLDAGLVVHRGDQVVNVPLVAILEKAQHTPPQSRLVVSVERLAWDSLTVDFREPAADGIAAPGSVVPVSIGLNILWPEAAEVAVRTALVLRSIRGGEVVWRSAPPDRLVVTTNGREPVLQTLNVPAPQNEGSYLLELSATWELTQGREGSRIGRLIRRRRPAPAASSAVRRVVLTVVDPQARPGGCAWVVRSRSMHSIWGGRGACGRWRTGGRRRRGRAICVGGPAGGPDRAVASRAAAGLDHAHQRRGVEARPGRRHRPGVVGSRPQGGSSRPTASPHGQGARRRAVGLGRGGRRARRHELIASAAARRVRIGTVDSSGRPSGRVQLAGVAELAGDGARSGQPQPRCRGQAGKRRTGRARRAGGPSRSRPSRAAATGRGLGLYLSGPARWSHSMAATASMMPLRPPPISRNTCSYCGATAVVVSEELADRSIRRALNGQADEDPTGPDRLETIWRVSDAAGKLDVGGAGARPRRRRCRACLRPTRRRPCAADWCE